MSNYWKWILILERSIECPLLTLSLRYTVNSDTAIADLNYWTCKNYRPIIWQYLSDSSGKLKEIYILDLLLLASLPLRTFLLLLAWLAPLLFLAFHYFWRPYATAATSHIAAISSVHDVVTSLLLLRIWCWNPCYFILLLLECCYCCWCHCCHWHACWLWHRFALVLVF